MSVIDRSVGLQYVVVLAAVCEPMEGRFNVCHRPQSWSTICSCDSGSV